LFDFDHTSWYSGLVQLLNIHFNWNTFNKWKHMECEMHYLMWHFVFCCG